MDDLRSRVAAFLSGPYILGDESHLIARYARGDLASDPETLNLLSNCMQAAQAEAPRLEGATSGPARDARHCYRKMAELLTEIQAELSARQ